MPNNKDSALPAIKSIEDITDPLALRRAKEFLAKPGVLGAMIWGSRATGFGQPTTDYDLLFYVTDEYFDKLTPLELGYYEFDESVTPKRLAVDYSFFSDKIFQQQLTSPLDIDHAAYTEGSVLYDPSGKLEEWRQRLARYPIEQQVERITIRQIHLVIAYYNAQLDSKRGYLIDAKLNLQRTMQVAVNLWFNLQKQWVPPLKWWSRHVKRLGMNDEVYKLFVTAIDTPTLESVGAVITHLKEGIIAAGVDPKHFHEDFMNTLTLQGRERLIKNSYL